jgi:hypothetical protein
MTQTLYAHMNKIKIKKKKIQRQASEVTLKCGVWAENVVQPQPTKKKKKG